VNSPVELMWDHVRRMGQEQRRQRVIYLGSNGGPKKYAARDRMVELNELNDQWIHRAVAADTAWSKLQADHPDVAARVLQFCRDHPDPNVVHRAIRAGELYAHGHVHKNGTPDSYDVPSQSHPSIKYCVHFTGKTDAYGTFHPWSCIMVDHPNASKKAEYCPDFAETAPDLGNGRRCKHMIAAWLKKTEAPAAATVEASLPDTSVRNPDNHQDTTTRTIPQTVMAWASQPTRLAAEAWQTHPDADPEVTDFHDPLLDAW